MTTPAPVLDRRVRRTRAALQRAMVELVNEQGYEAISIDGLAARADVTRTTFYAHYAGKEELLTAVVDSFADEVIAALDDPALGERPGARLQLLLERARASADVLRIIARGEGDGLPLRHFTDRVKGVLETDLDARLGPGRVLAIDRSLLIELRTAQVVTTVAWFVEHGCHADPAEVALAVTAIGERGLYSGAVVTPD